MPVQYDDLKNLFLAARDLPAGQRAALLSGRCAHDPDLRGAVERMLQAHDHDAGPLPLTPPRGVKGPLPPSPADVATGSVETARRGGSEPSTESTALPLETDFPGYRLVRELNRGGQGVVYLAIQESTRRKVAIKVLLAGPYASASARFRFEREIELLAHLRHPGVVSVFHSGVTHDGRNYFVMEYVSGRPLNAYVRENKLGLEAALRLFVRVCHAVQCAHQRGIIHRDLKPGNILVEGDANPRVLDFGLAKRLAAPAETVVSMSRDMVGTLPYMSPEQTRGTGDEVDTRTDVYALGVMLYELLTGELPYPVSGSMGEVVRHINETPPTPPSRCWRPDSGIAQSPLAGKRRKANPINADVQTIVLKALAKERERRYQSAGELARDIENYLVGEPIEARRDSAWYVLRKVLTRNRAVAIAFLFVLALIIGCGGISVYFRQEARSAESERRRVAGQLGECRVGVDALIAQLGELAKRLGECEARARREASASTRPAHEP